jgi:hypothetical protein
MTTQTAGSGALRVPLTQTQVDAADRLQAGLPGWKLYEGILRDLSDRFPSNCDLAHVLPKAITLNKLYATGILAIQQMAGHIVAVSTSASDHSSPGFADRIALLTDLGPKRKTMNCLSFASKYCHFFVDASRFAILDTFAKDALMLHLGKGAVKASSYVAYLETVDRLIAAASLTCSYAQLDHYLWLRGQHTRFQQHGEDADINGEVRPLFAHPDAECRGLIEQAFGPQS